MRRTSTDEIPNLVYLLRGEMALVGPLPALPTHLDLHGHPRSEVHPGITDWAQVKGRADIGWPERVEFGDWCVAHRSTRRDLRIVAMTILPVLTGKAVSPD